MSYIKEFWLATAAAAPVITLAAVVALPDVTGAQHAALLKVREGESHDPHAHKKLQEAVRYFRMATIVVWMAASNVIIQAALLAVSLSALASPRNVIPQWLAIVLAVGGILLLAVTLFMGAAIRRLAERQSFASSREASDD